MTPSTTQPSTRSIPAFVSPFARAWPLYLLAATVTASEGVAPLSNTSSPVYIEVSRKVVNFEDHKMNLVRVRTPSLPKAPPPPTPLPSSPEDQATSDRLAAKDYVTLNVTATVYLRSGQTPVTELRWSDETGARHFRAWSSADFRYLDQLQSLETETTVYDRGFPFVDVISPEDLPADQKSPIPARLSLSSTEAVYVVDTRATGLKDQETTLAGLDYIHAYYQLHHAELKAAYNKRDLENTESERELREHPPKTPDATLRWWPISTNRVPSAR